MYLVICLCYYNIIRWVFNMNKKIRITLFIIVTLSLLALTILLFPLMLSLRNEANRIELQNTVNRYGFVGWLIMLSIQIIQVVVAILPGEPIEVIMGLMYGPILGTLTCILGIVIGTLIIFVFTKAIGKPFISLFVDPDKFSDYKFINTSNKKDSLVFILFFIPGTPKDVLTYFAPFIKMNIFRFILISTFARIPSIISSTISGKSIIDGNWLLTIIIFSSTFIIAIIGYIINSKFLSKNK